LTLGYALSVAIIVRHPGLDETHPRGRHPGGAIDGRGVHRWFVKGTLALREKRFDDARDALARS